MGIPKQRQTILWILFILLMLGLNAYFWYQGIKLNADTREALVAIENVETLTGGQITRAEIEAGYERIAEAEQRALGYLSVFESLGLAITVLGIIGAVLALVLGGGVQEAQQKFQDAEQRYQGINDRLEANIRNSEQRYTELQGELSAKLQLAIQNASIAELLISMARQQYELGYLKGAKEIYERALKLAPETPVIPYRIGYILTQLEELDEAEKILLDALKLDSEFPNALASLGFVYRRRGDKSNQESQRKEFYKQAEKYLVQALSLNPYLVDDDGESWNGALAGLYRRMEREKDAIYHYGQAAHITPQSSYPKLNLLLLQWKHNETEKLSKQLEEVETLLFGKIKKDKDTYWDRADILNIQLALGKDDASIQESMATFLQVLPKDAKDVLPRVIASTEFIMNAAGFDGDKRDKQKIQAVIEVLKAEQEKRRQGFV